MSEQSIFTCLLFDIYTADHYRSVTARGNQMINETKVREAIRANIRRLREKHPKTEKKVTQAELAEAVGIERATLTNIEKGNQRAPIHIIYRLCEYFSVPLAEILPPVDLLMEQSEADVEVAVGPDKYQIPKKMSELVNRVRTPQKL